MDQHIVFDQVSHVYNANSPFQVKALDNVNLSIPRGKVTAIIGHTGSGKSTLIQHLNVLLRPTSGTVNINGEVITRTSENKNLKALRKEVSVVFQFPESQLFDETVLSDVMFGPKNFGSTEDQAEAIAREVLALVGIPEELYDRSPFDLSGGQMRRVAIAGVLAVDPSVLVLDEPTAGLDPAGQEYMMKMFMRRQKEKNLTLILVTHKMEDVAKYAEHVVVLERGSVIKTGTPQDIFSDYDWVVSKQLSLPQTIDFVKEIDDHFDSQFLSKYQPLTVEALAEDLLAMRADLRGGRV